MSEKKWLGLAGAAEGTAPETKISRTQRQLVTAEMQDVGQQSVISVTYRLGGAWVGTVEGFDNVVVPNTTEIEQEGAPAVPKDGIFVAVPADAAGVEVRLMERKLVPVDRTISLAPAPKQFKEAEFQVFYQPDPRIYGSDDPYPGRDYDFLGLKTIAGLRVAHILVYLGQYRPHSQHMELVQSMTLEISYQTPPTRDRRPTRKPREVPEHSLILGLDLLEEEKDFVAPPRDLSGFSDVPIEILEAAQAPLARADLGISLLEAVEDQGQDAPAITMPMRGGVIGGAAISPGAIVGLAAAPKLKIPGLIAEYVIITSGALSASVEPLRAAKSGWPFYAKVATTEDIQKEFASASLKESIKAFIAWATANWTVPPRFVVLAADTDIIPMHTYVQNNGSYASDHYYQDIVGDLVPELTVSRLPTSNAATLKSVCEQLIRYDGFRAGDWGGWQNLVMLCAYAAPTYETTCDEIETKIKGRYAVIKRYAKDTSKTDVINTINAGVLCAVYRGHGSKQAWSSSNGLTTTDVPGLNTHTRPPFVLSICCENGWIDDNSLETIAEAFIRQRKAVAVFAASRDSWTYPNNDLAKYIFDAVMTGGCVSPGDITRFAKTKMVKNHGTSGWHLDNTVMYNLFGDPTAHVAANAEYLRGRWAMDHDGWQGTLNINQIWNYRTETQDGYVAPVWSVSGNYVGADKKSYNFAGTLGGFDANQLAGGSKRSDLKFEITIAFSATNNQRFIGYVHSWTRNRISGLTWWSNHPFGWTALKS